MARALTPRELEIARLAVTGMNAPEIAARLGIRAYTVKAHLRQAYRKTRTGNRGELRTWLAAQGTPAGKPGSPSPRPAGAVP